MTRLFRRKRARRPSRGHKPGDKVRDHAEDFLLLIEIALLAASLIAVRLNHSAKDVVPLTLSTAAAGVGIAYVLARRWEQRRIVPKAVPTFALDTRQAIRTANSVAEAYGMMVCSIAEFFHSPFVCLLVREESQQQYRCLAGTASFEAGPLPVLACDAFVVRRLAGLNEPLTIEAGDLFAWVNPMALGSAAAREKRGREVQALQRMSSSMLVQVRTRDELIGILSLAIPADADSALSPDEQKILKDMATQLALLIENANLLERVVRHARVEHELALAAQVQRRLLPDMPPATLGLEIAAWCEPAREVGGDCYDFLALDDGTFVLAMADVSGKGISAALLTSVVQAAFRAQSMASALHRQSPSEMMTAMNRLLCASLSPEKFVTCFVGQLDVQRNRFTYVNAGHGPPLLFRSNRKGNGAHETSGAPLQLTAGGPVLGVFAGASYDQAEVELCPGDVLLAFTDGLTEALDLGGEELGEERVTVAVTASLDQNAEQISAVVRSRVHAWTTGVEQYDDITVMVVKKSN
jgi:serine phosphatase RsbU (regulator of sigma subunit)